MYKLDDIDIETYGAKAILQGERTALEGAFSFPKRTGKTEYNWGTHVEPFVEESEILFEGRVMKLTARIRGNDTAHYMAQLDAFKSACITCSTLTTGYDTFQVLLRDEIKVKEYSGRRLAIVTATFWEPEYLVPEVDIQAVASAGYSLDGCGLRETFGIGISGRSDEKSVGKRIEVSTTDTFRQTQYRDKADVTLQCWMKGDGINDLYARMRQFHALCAAPGIRMLQLPDGTIARGYVRDGFTAKVVHSNIVKFDFKLRVI